jgi:hypothetical protein
LTFEYTESFLDFVQTIPGLRQLGHLSNMDDTANVLPPRDEARCPCRLNDIRNSLSKQLDILEEHIQGVDDQVAALPSGNFDGRHERYCRGHDSCREATSFPLGQ